MGEAAAIHLRIRPGLFRKKHVLAMGDAIWLYGFIQELVRWSGPNAGSTTANRPYRHADAVAALGRDKRTIERWFARLWREKYITFNRRYDEFDVTIAKYRDDPSGPTGSISEEAPAVTQDGDKSVGVSLKDSDKFARHSDRFVQDGDKSVGVTRRVRSTRARSGDSRESIDSPLPSPPPEARSRALSPLQLIANAYLLAVGREPTAVTNYGRFTRVLNELLRRTPPATPDDVAACTHWLSSEPFYADSGKPPAPERVVEQYPGWLRLGRPKTWQPPARSARGGTAPPPARIVDSALAKYGA